MQKLAPRHRLIRTRPVDRDSHLLELCLGKRVLHLACAAWPATETLYDNGFLLHRRLMGVCRQLAGYDISEPGLEALRGRGVGDLFLVDLLNPEQVAQCWARLPFEPEIVIAGELVEHLDAPGPLLRNCRRHMRDDSRMIITVPNSFSLRGFLHVLRGYEKVAPDHVMYLSPTNLQELTSRCGFEIEELRWYEYSLPRTGIDSAMSLLLRPVLRVWPQLSEGMITTCRPVPVQDKVVG